MKSKYHFCSYTTRLANKYAYYLRFGDMVKLVVDVVKKVMAIGGDLHADEEAILVENGSEQNNFWGINYYLEKDPTETIEFDLMINFFLLRIIGQDTLKILKYEIRS